MGKGEILALRAWRFPLFSRVIWLLVPVLYIVLTRSIYSTAFLPPFFLLVASLFFYGSYSVLVNDYFDAPFDLAAGKKALPVGPGVTGALLLSPALCLAFSAASGYSSLLLLAGMLLATLYSAPPIRLKERGFWGVLSDTLIEFMPLLFILAFFSTSSFGDTSLRWGLSEAGDLVLFSLFYFFANIVSQLEHQIKDFRGDRKSGLKTFVTERGVEQARKILKAFALISLLLLLPLLLFLLRRVEHFWLPLLGFGIFHAVHPRMNPEVRGAFETPLLFADWVYLFLLNLLPLYLALLLAWNYPPYSVLFVTTLIFDSKLVRMTAGRMKALLVGRTRS